MLMLHNILANWPAPSHIGAMTTTRINGTSKDRYASNNMGLHVGDVPQHVLNNRQRLKEALSLPREPIWLNQTHSTNCINVEQTSSRDADAAVSRNIDHPLAIMTADCMPILLCNQQGTEIAAVHAGWRGLANGIIENTLSKMLSPSNDLLAWIGPCICRQCFEIGNEVYDFFIKRYAFVAPAFDKGDLRMHADLSKIAEFILLKQGVKQVSHAQLCTYELDHQFYSYRRDGETGRMATLIWFKQ